MELRRLLVVSILLFAACDEKSRPSPGESSDPGATSLKAEAEAPPAKPEKLPAGFAAPTPRPAASTNAVYIATKSDLLAIEGGKFVVVAPLPKYFLISDITTDRDGSLWILGSNSVAKLEGKSWKTYKLSDGNGALKHLAVDSEENLDVVGVYGISHFDGSTWTLNKSDELLGKKSGGIQGLLIDGKGRGYATAYNKLLYREAKTWKAIDSKALYSAMDLAPDGTFAVATSSGVMLTSGDTWKELEVGRCSSIQGVYLRGEKVIVRCYDAVLVVERKGGATKRYGTKKGEELDIDRIAASDVDSAGRVYIGAPAGFAVLLADGTVQRWPLGSVPEMASGVRAVFASGAGADTLPGKEAIRFGALAGKLAKKGKPLGNVEIEMCTNTTSFLKKGETPCTKASWKAAGKTGADGSFQFDKVPVGELQFAYRPVGEKKWVLVIGFNCCSKLEEGKLLDIGAIDMM